MKEREVKKELRLRGIKPARDFVQYVRNNVKMGLLSKTKLIQMGRGKGREVDYPESIIDEIVELNRLQWPKSLLCEVVNISKKGSVLEKLRQLPIYPPEEKLIYSYYDVEDKQGFPNYEILLDELKVEKDSEGEYVAYIDTQLPLGIWISTKPDQYLEWEYTIGRTSSLELYDMNFHQFLLQCYLKICKKLKLDIHKYKFDHSLDYEEKEVNGKNEGFISIQFYWLDEKEQKREKRVWMKSR